MLRNMASMKSRLLRAARETSTWSHLIVAAVTWLKYCWYGVKLYPINQLIETLRKIITPILDTFWLEKFKQAFGWPGEEIYIRKRVNFQGNMYIFSIKVKGLLMFVHPYALLISRALITLLYARSPTCLQCSLLWFTSRNQSSKYW